MSSFRRTRYTLAAACLSALSTLACAGTKREPAPPPSRPERAATYAPAGSNEPSCLLPAIERLPTREQVPFPCPHRERLRDPTRVSMARGRLVAQARSVEQLERYLAHTKPRSPEWTETLRGIAVRYAILAWDAELRLLHAERERSDATRFRAELCTLRGRSIASSERVLREIVEPAAAPEPWMSHATYVLGLEHERTGDFAAAETAYRRLLDRFAASEWAPLARLGLAELKAQRARNGAAWHDVAETGYRPLFESEDEPRRLRIYAGHALAYATLRAEGCAAADGVFERVSTLAAKEPSSEALPRRLEELWRALRNSHCGEPAGPSK